MRKCFCKLGECWIAKENLSHSEDFNRKRLAREIPGLRPWEVREVEQVMDLMTFNRQWYREDLGDFTTKPDYEKDWFETFQVRQVSIFPKFWLLHPS
jgi:hypothetical protein